MIGFTLERFKIFKILILKTADKIEINFFDVFSKTFIVSEVHS